MRSVPIYCPMRYERAGFYLAVIALGVCELP